MKITFDPMKRDATVKKRGLYFDDAEQVFEGLTFTAEDARKAYGETRYQTIGFFEGRMLMIVWTPRGHARHIISMRKCNAKEQKAYQDRFKAL